jgi:hypothetical protein
MFWKVVFQVQPVGYDNYAAIFLVQAQAAGLAENTMVKIFPACGVPDDTTLAASHLVQPLHPFSMDLIPTLADTGHDLSYSFVNRKSTDHLQQPFFAEQTD